MTSTDSAGTGATNTPVPAKGGKFQAARGVLMAMLVGAAFAAAGVMVGRSASDSEWMRLRFDALVPYDLLLLPLTFFIAILLHELGHLSGGLLRGMRFLLLIVGPLRLRRTISGLRLDWFLNSGTFGGLAAALPDPQRPIRGQLLPLIVGGPLASLLLALLALWLSTIVDGRWSAHLLILGGLSALIFMVTALPMRAGGAVAE